MTTEKNYFEELSKVICTVEEKGMHKLRYVTWAEAWAKLKEHHPTAHYKVHEQNEMPYFVDAKCAFVKVTVSVPDGEHNRIDHTVCMPVLDFKNDPILPIK